ncbi:hypothetical protein BGZ97_002953 [Linnemannia gamsii]|uniref:ABC transporter domain-containing protein n=1 Tax=Linnemannia gamsii TaxID=64522 RepID=A0A9P6UHU7_9FUNG|nr:hypothetical protein BGZ97_002953 [Linnemannia gamsii]
MNADLIYVMDKSVILESGTYASPMALGGTYTEFVAKQQLKTRGTDIEAPEYEANPTGCEKSTVIALLERWYDVNGGQVAVDKYNIRVLQLYNIREHIALVGQGPVLFDMSIKDNILYGLPNSVKAQERWSRGQKQRIAIARALIWKPKILLLDETTSALDSVSEKLVQEALDRARHGRTTIVIAHRLSTVQDANLILVLRDGNVVESGRHYELIGLGGDYANLCQQQNL